MVLTDRHFIAENFDILFAIFGLVVQKLCKFKVHIHFLLVDLIPEIGRNRFAPTGGLATEAERRGRSHGGIHVGPEGH